MALLTVPVDAEQARTEYERAPEDAVYAFQTSGSTGRPKTVLLSRRAVRASARFAREALAVDGSWLLALPAHYVAGFNVVSRASEMGSAIISTGPGRFTAAAFAAAADRLPAGPRYTSLVPAQLQRILDDATATAALESFDRLLLGGQAAPPALLERARAAGIRLFTTYGSTETSGGCLWDGRGLGDTEVALVDGVVHLAGSVLADGYLDDPELTVEAFPVIDGRRWHRTSDLGELHDGRLRLLGRVDDVIVSGGVKVSLALVESLVREQAGFGDAVVVAAPDPRWGQVPIVVTASEAELDMVRIAAAAGPAARPGRVIRIPEMPVLASGKPDRRALRVLAAAG